MCTWIKSSPREICELGIAEAFLIWAFMEINVNGVQWGKGKMGVLSILMSISAVKRKKKEA